MHFASKSVEVMHASLYHWSLKNKLTLVLSRCIWKTLGGDTSCCKFFPHFLSIGIYLNNLIGIPLRLREERVALIRDIKKMFDSVHLKILEQYCHLFSGEICNVSGRQTYT